MFRNSNKIPVGGDRAGPLNSTKFLKLKKNNMLKRVIKAEPENVLRRYLAMLLTVVTFITAIPLSNLMTAKAVDEYNYSLTVTIDLDGGECDDIYYKSNVDRDGCGYSGGQWVDKLGIGKTFLDRTSTPHTVIGRGADTPCEGTFTVRADAVGITPHVVISTPTRDGYTFEGWDTNTDTREYDGDTAFEVGAYAPDNITITATWSKNEPDTSNMTISWDSGVDYVGADGYSSDYDFTFSGQDHNFPTGSTLQLNAHIKDGYSIVGFQEDAVSPGFIWNDYWTNANYPGVIFDSWSMNSNRSIKVLTKTTLSFSYDDGFTNSSHTETVNTDSAYKDYPKFKENYELDYVEDLDTGDKWYSYDGKDSKGSYTSWTAYKPRRIRYHSKLAEGAKLTLNLDQNGATTKGTERVDVYHNIKISDVTIPKKEYTATFFDGNKKVHDDIIDKFKFLGYRNDEEGLIHTNTTSKFRDYYRPGSIGSTSTTVTGNATYEGTSTYPVTESGNKVTTTVYAGSGDYSDVNFRLDCYGYEGYVMVSYNGGSDSGESWYVEASTEDESSKEIYSGYDFSADGYGYIYVKDWIEIFVSGDSNDWWTDISVVSVDMTTLKKGYWYDENGKGLINYPLNRNHTIKAVWSGGDITLPEAPAKEGYTFVGWRTEDAKLQTANWSNDDEDYLDCKNNYGGDVAKWFKASREGKAQNDFATNYYLVPNSYYLNDEVMHFQYYYVDYAGDDVGLGKDTKFIACYEEIPKVTLKTSSDKGISRAYIDGNVNTRSLKVYPNTNHTINAELNKGYKFAGWYNGNTLYSYSMSKQITMGDKDMLLVAKSNPINYKIAYNLDGGTYGTSHPTSADYDTMVTIDNPSKSGYTFTGWTIIGYDSTTSGHNAATWTGETGTSYKNLTATDGATVTFTATWSKEAPKTANLQTTGDVGIKTTSHPNKTVVNIGSSVQVSAVLNTGYVFKGWYNGDVKVSDDLSFVYTMPNTDTVLTAKTDIKWYTMTFDPNGGILKNPGNNLYNAEWKNGNTVSVGWNINDFCYMNGDIPTRRGYRFTGWYLGSESIYNKYGIAIKNSSLYSYDTDYHWRYDGNVTVKAGWDAINYKISYKVATGAGSIPSQTVHYGDSFTLADGNAFTYTGHTFSHWYVRRSSDKKVFCYDGDWHTTDGSDLYGSDVSNWYPYNNNGLTFEMNDAWTRSDTDADEEFVFWGFWTADEYSITYNLNGGTLNGKTNPDTYNVETATFTLNNPTRLGYTFAGWSGTDITGTAKIVTVNKGSTGNRTYTATWTPVNYTISYDLNGGAVVVSNPTSYNIETPTFTLNNPVRLGYVFVGWTGSNGTTPQKAVSVYKGSTGNKSYKANWTAADVGYTINHYVMDINGNYPSTPTKTERLSGFTDTSVTAKRLSLGNGFTYPDVQTVKVKADGTTVVNYYYSRNQYYLNLNGYLKQRVSENFADLTETVKDINGKDVKHTFATSVVKVNGSVHAKGNGVTDFYEKVYYGSTYEIITTAKTGYTIIDNTGTFKGTITGDTVVTPHVSINQYTVKYEPNKPSKATNDVTKMADQFVYYNRQRKLTTNTYKYTGYDFTGWNTKADGTGTAYTDGQTIENLSSADGAVITLYAQWKIHTHKLKVYVSNENADGTFGSEWLWQDKILEYNTPYSYTGYVNDTVYQQISTSGTMYDSDITIHLKAMRKTFNQKLTVYYEQPDGSFDAGTVVINKAYRYGQTVSWNRNADVTYKAASISWTVAGANVKELKIYRQQYKIIVNGADKHTTTKGTGTYRYGYELWITAEVEAGYHFINWNMDSSLTESSMKIEVTGDKTYTAYVEANKYLITYNLNKPARASSTPKLNTQNTWEYEYNSKILYMPDKTTTLLTGWTFEGWYTEADGGTKIKVGDIYKWIGNITLYAHWTENTYTIHYESDGGTAINDINVKYEDPVKLSAVPYRPGYIFSYWNTKADASGHSYEGSETVRHLSTSGTVTLYAVWSKKAIAQIGAAVNMTEKNGYVFGHITDDSVSIRTYVIDENGNILIK